MKPKIQARAGFSLVELAVSAAILFLVLTGVAVVSSASDRAYRTGTTTAQLEEQAATAVDRIVAELSIAGIDTFAVLPPTGKAVKDLEYEKAVGYVDGDVIWTGPRWLRLELEAGELDDGLDNNHNGLVDECQVVLTEELGAADERRLVLTRWVSELAVGELANLIDDNGNGLIDEPGFCVVRSGETFAVRLSLQRRDAGGRLLSRSAATSTRVRNRQSLGGGS
jgi:hypothetical protein